MNKLLRRLINILKSILKIIINKIQKYYYDKNSVNNYFKYLQTDNTKTTYSIIGFGGMGKIHFNALKQNNNVKLVSVCDLKEQGNLPLNVKYYSDVDELIKDKIESDIFIIATTANYHLEIANKLIKYGAIKLLIEKPISSNILESKNFLNLVKNKNVKIELNYLRRFFNTYCSIKNLIEKGKIGNVRSIYLYFSKAEFGMNGSHFIDLVMFLFNKKPLKVSASLIENMNYSSSRGNSFYDPGGNAQIIFEDGINFFMDLDQNADRKRIDFSIIGTKGRINVDEVNRTWDLIIDGIVKTDFVYDSTDNVTDGCLRSFLNLSSKNKSISSVEDAYLALRTIAAVHLSSKQNRKYIDVNSKEVEDYNLNIP